MRKCEHFSEIQVIEILAVIAVGGYLNRWNDTIATVTDTESIDFANEVLRPVGWEPESMLAPPKNGARRIRSIWAGQRNKAGIKICPERRRATMHPELKQHPEYFPEIIPLADNVFMAFGFAASNVYMIVGDDSVHDHRYDRNDGGGI